jgi:hypothetical protein
MAVALRQMERAFRRGNASGVGVSPWDASAIFFQIGQGGRSIPGSPPRVLILLYAADLAFRLRWQIQPALDAGEHVIAAPYVETPIAFGVAAGLPWAWLKSVFEFAPQPDLHYRVPERSIPTSVRGTPANSFVEFCFAQLRGNRGNWPIEDVRRGFDAHLDRLESAGKCRVAAKPILGRSAVSG